VAEDESDSVLVDGDTDSFIGDILAMRMTSVETETGPDSAITVDQCHIGKEVEVCANVPKVKTIEAVETQKSPVDELAESDSILVVGLGQSDGTIVDLPRKSDYATDDAPGEPDNSLGNPYNVTLDSDKEPDRTIVKFGELNNMIVDAVEESNDTTMNAPVELDNAIFHMLGDSDNATDMPGEAMSTDTLNMTEVDPTTSQYDMIDLDIPGTNSRVEMVVREGESIEAANTLYTMSQYHSPRSFGGLGSWQVIDWLRMTHQDDRQGWGSRPSTGINPKELLERWDWVFQRK
jgi:hypothetical protein